MTHSQGSVVLDWNPLPAPRILYLLWYLLTTCLHSSGTEWAKGREKNIPSLGWVLSPGKGGNATNGQPQPLKIRCFTSATATGLTLVPLPV